MSTDEYVPVLVTVDLRQVVQVNKDNYAKFLASVKHAPVMVRNSMLLAYERAVSDITQTLDASKVPVEP